MNDSNLGVLIVQLTSPNDVKIRDLLVSIDDEPAENLSFDGSLILTVPAGTHTLRVTNRLFTKTDEFTIASGEEITYSAGNIAGGCFSALMILGGTGAYRVMLERV